VKKKIKNLYLKKKNRIKIKISTPLTDNIYTNKEEFEILKKNERANVNRKKTPNIIINNITYTLKIKNQDTKFLELNLNNKRKCDKCHYLFCWLCHKCCNTGKYKVDFAISDYIEENLNIESYLEK